MVSEGYFTSTLHHPAVHCTIRISLPPFLPPSTTERETN